MISKLSILPRWIILFLDLSITCISYCLASLVKENLFLPGIIVHELFEQLTVLTLVNMVVFASLKTFSGMIPGLQDAQRILAATGISTFLLFLYSHLSFSVLPVVHFSPVILLIYFTFSFLSLITYRVMSKHIFGFLRNSRMDKKTVLIFGASEAGVATKRVLENYSANKVSILAFIDDDPKKINKVVDGVPIIDVEKFKQVALKQSVDELILAAFTLPVEKVNEIVDFCLDHHIKY